MKKITKSEAVPTIVIEGYKITVQVTDKSVSIIDILEDLLGNQLEKI